jgi:hypothetical protein
MAIVDPYEVAATAIKVIIDAEFEPDGYTAIHDKLHEALGTRRTEIGIAPADEGWQRHPNNANVRETFIEVRFFDRWDKEIDPAQTVNPFRITNYAARFEEAVQRASANMPGTGDVWYFDVLSIGFPDDPTGNKTRFEAQIRVHGNNHGLIESGN